MKSGAGYHSGKKGNEAVASDISKKIYRQR